MLKGARTPEMCTYIEEKEEEKDERFVLYTARPARAASNNQYTNHRYTRPGCSLWALSCLRPRAMRPTSAWALTSCIMTMYLPSSCRRSPPLMYECVLGSLRYFELRATVLT